ncbi:MAG: hypothetical protein JETCAE02_27810 [Anaerolineaceae bacterium]|nr:hypothetical protein [Anaerolineae bacterium]MBL1171295.1 hypothetical protein [Chloroflexota bacterium]MDL1926410.1 hypothetical protein [Anaerolineae bacterium AMX1]WKZ51981.1 MAG: hypothetical protein QY329_04475 [Anaerolineales bacterium]GJQ40369.1 MAG: hypothetical protein JETCAE02_27810 [Anaerolineaceae bacterium]
MTKSLNDDTAARFRAIMDGDDEVERVPAAPTPPPEPSGGVLDRLPRASEDETAASAPPPEPSGGVLDRLPRAVKAASAPGPAAPRSPVGKTRPGSGVRFKVERERLAPAFWTITSWIGLAVDAILIAVVIILLLYVRRLNVQYNQLLALKDMPLDTVRGLYSNFESMNNAHIRATIPLATEIPVQFDLQINQQVQVALSEPVRINGATVTVVTGGLEISNAPADIILPAGTLLPIWLTLTVPVDKMVPVAMQVPVDIDLAQTELGASFTGLMDVLEPLYCLLDARAVDRNNVSICEKAKFPPK